MNKNKKVTIRKSTTNGQVAFTIMRLNNACEVQATIGKDVKSFSVGDVLKKDEIDALINAQYPVVVTSGSY